MDAETTNTVGFELGSIRSAARSFANQHASDVFVYSRVGNPTVRRWEALVAKLEKADYCLGFASGMAAITAALAVGIKSSGNGVILVPEDIYSGTKHVLKHVFEEMNGARVAFVDIDSPAQSRTAAFLDAIEQHEPSTVYFEPISNPFVSLLDGPAIIEKAKAFGALVLVDNTFASPYLCTPLSWGADLVIQSASKYLCGHNDTLAGCISTNDADLLDALQAYRSLTGGVLSADSASRLLAYARSFELRVRAQNQNAAFIADRLKDHPAISRVHFPGLDGGDEKALADRLFEGKGYGAIVSFQLESGLRGCERLLEVLDGQIPHLGTLADIESSLIHIETSFQMGYPDDSFRLSVGVESATEFLSIFEPALQSLQPK